MWRTSTRAAAVLYRRSAVRTVVHTPVLATPLRCLTYSHCCAAASSSSSSGPAESRRSKRSVKGHEAEDDEHGDPELAVVTIEGDAKLVRDATRESLREHSSGHTAPEWDESLPSRQELDQWAAEADLSRRDPEATATKAKKRKATTATASTARKSAAAKAEDAPDATTTKPRKTRAKTPAAAASTPAAAAGAAGGLPSDSDNPALWQEWDVMSKPFARDEDEAEFQKWARILEEEEQKVDRELEEEEELGEDEDDAVTEEDADEDADVEADEDANEDDDIEIDDEDVGEIEVDELGEDRAEEEAEWEEGVEEDVDPIEQPAFTVPSAKVAPPTPVAPKPAPQRKKRPSNPGTVSNGVRTRMLNIGGEQVMELSGVDEDEDEFEVEYDAQGNEIEREEVDEEDDEWEGSAVDLAANDPAALEADDPEAQVGRGVGGVFFARKDFMELNEKDLVESFTKGSGKGGQKVNKTNTCVNLLHLPTATRVKCQFSRDLAANRARARTIMRQRLEEMLLGARSRSAIKAQRERKRKDRNRRRRAAKDEEAEEPVAVIDDVVRVEAEVIASSINPPPPPPPTASTPAAAATAAVPKTKTKVKKVKVPRTLAEVQAAAAAAAHAAAAGSSSSNTAR